MTQQNDIGPICRCDTIGSACPDPECQRRYQQAQRGPLIWEEEVTLSDIVKGALAVIIRFVYFGLLGLCLLALLATILFVLPFV